MAGRAPPLMQAVGCRGRRARSVSEPVGLQRACHVLAAVWPAGGEYSDAAVVVDMAGKAPRRRRYASISCLAVEVTWSMMGAPC